ncbi:serpin B8 [Trichonephila inaurata madagascariensis]|uniref:Serpin B8 n=1 Tax=Trichonephila inaurata madagascariensis TaxID=2747483 RepID=A0A8X7CEV5_9ARAC|nr:serpin B8 [Trichonephila inaurata madagascariensis]
MFYRFLKDKGDPQESSVGLTLLGPPPKGHWEKFSSPLFPNAMTMLYFGARTETAVEINGILQFENMSEQELSTSFDLLLSAIEKSSDKYSLECANAAMIQNKFPVHDSFKKVLVESFHAVLMQEDFAKDPNLAVTHVNDWVKAKTKGMIKQLINRLSPLTVMIILNAVYFKGMWEHQFQKKNTRRQKFYNHGEEKKGTKVDMILESFGFSKNTYQAPAASPIRAIHVFGFFPVPEQA